MTILTEIQYTIIIKKKLWIMMNDERSDTHARDIDATL